MKYLYVLKDYPYFIGNLVLTGAINYLDSQLSRRCGYTILHILWHLVAAYTAHQFLEKI